MVFGDSIMRQECACWWLCVWVASPSFSMLVILQMLLGNTVFVSNNTKLDPFRHVQLGHALMRCGTTSYLSS